MSRHGVEAPRDVKVVTLSNKGHDPVYFRQLARFEYDPERNAVNVARYIVARLNGRSPRPPDDIDWFEDKWAGRRRFGRNYNLQKLFIQSNAPIMVLLYSRCRRL